MSTLTTNYGFIKPDFSEASGPDELAENMIKAERALINLELGSAQGRGDKNMCGMYRNVSDDPVSPNSQGPFDVLTWTHTLNTAAWTPIFTAVGENFDTPSLGLSFQYTVGNFEFYHGGYYKVTWNLRLQMSNVTATEGNIRAALIGTDGTNPYTTDLGIWGSPIIVPLNTMTNLTDIGTEQLVKIIQPDRTALDGNYNTFTTGKNQRSYFNNSPFNRYFAIALAHGNTSSATATPLLNETYIHMEFIRGL